jgi:putative membrane protein
MKTNIKWILILVLVCFMFVVMIQNTEVVSIQFLFWTLTMSRILMISFLVLLGLVTGYIIGRMQGHTSRKKGTS